MLTLSIFIARSVAQLGRRANPSLPRGGAGSLALGSCLRQAQGQAQRAGERLGDALRLLPQPLTPTLSPQAGRGGRTRSARVVRHRSRGSFRPELWEQEGSR